MGWWGGAMYSPKLKPPERWREHICIVCIRKKIEDRPDDFIGENAENKRKNTSDYLNVSFLIFRNAGDAIT